MNLERTDLLTAIKDFNIARMNANTLKELFIGGRFRQETATKFAFFTYPQAQIKKGVPFSPLGLAFQDTQKNLGDIDKNEIICQMEAWVLGDSDKDLTLRKIQQSFEEFRKELVFDPTVSIDVKDTVYQIYISEDTGTVPFEWEAEEEYTILANILGFTGGVGYTIVDGIQIDALSVVVPTTTTGIFKQKFTTGLIPLEEHKQFMTIGGGTMQVRTAILKGDFTSLDDETIKNIVEAKDRSGLYDNLVDNDNDFANWDVDDFKKEYTVDTYTGSSTCTFNNQTGGIRSWNNDNYSVVTMTTAYNLSKGLIDSNEGIIKVRERDTENENEFVELVFNSAVFGTVKTMDTDQPIANKSIVSALSKGLKRFRDIKIDLKMQNIPVLNLFVDEILDDKIKINTQYDIVITLFDGGKTYTKIVVLESNGITLIRGEQEALQLQFREYLQDG